MTWHELSWRNSDVGVGTSANITYISYSHLPLTLPTRPFAIPYLTLIPDPYPDLSSISDSYLSSIPDPTLNTCSTLIHSIHLRFLSTDENSFCLEEVFLLFYPYVHTFTISFISYLPDLSFTESSIYTSRTTIVFFSQKSSYSAYNSVSVSSDNLSNSASSPTRRSDVSAQSDFDLSRNTSGTPRSTWEGRNSIVEANARRLPPTFDLSSRPRHA